MISILWIIFQVLIGFNLIFPLLLFLAHKMRSKAKLSSPVVSTELDYGIIVTAYEQTELLPAVVNSLLALDYSNYHIYVVADKCDISNLHFDDPRVSLLKPEEVLGGNVRSHFYAIERFVRDHQVLTIIDSDNLVDPGYLKELDVYFNQGFEAVQGVREAKNLNSTYACLDAARDIYYHYYDGQVLFDIGSSATLAGSGMAFTLNLYKQCLAGLDVSGAGFDKVLQSQIIKQNKRIAFARKAVVYDEKTSHPSQLVNQRSRWINTWFKYFSYGFSITGLGIKNGSINQFVFGLVLLRPPLFMFLILSLFCAAIQLFVYPIIAIVWLIGLLIFVLTFYLALTHSNTDIRIYRSLISIPKFIYYQLISLLNAKRANKRSVATKHGINS